MPIIRGQLYWAHLPGDKRRPVIVVSPQSRNDNASDVLVVPVSTSLRDGPWHVRLSKREAKLRRPSVAKCEQITTLRKEHLSSEPIAGPLAPRKMAEVERAVMRAIGIPVP